MKYVLLGVVLLSFGGCAHQNGGGWVVGNSMADETSGTAGMKAASPATDSCGCSGASTCQCETDCGCGRSPQPAQKKKK